VKKERGMALIKRLPALAVSLAIILGLAGCGTTKPEAHSWKLPKKENADSGMIIGRLDFPNNKKENPDNLVLRLENVELRNEAQAVRFGHVGETRYIMANNYFVVPNLKPGTYRFTSFRVGNLFHGLYGEEGFTYEVKPGQIKFIGSLDYLQYDQSFLEKLGKKVHYTIRKAERPTELEMLQWLSTTSAGSGWESAISKRIAESGRRP
jgi:hypothetical protein